MRASRWQAFNPLWNTLQNFQGEMNRLFDRYNEPFDGPAAFPPLNVWEEDDHLFVEAELPGLDKDALEVFVRGGNQLSLKGVRKAPAAPKKGLWHRQERGHGAFERVLTLPYPVDADKVDARFEHGVLTLKLAKHESARPRKIPVTGE